MELINFGSFELWFSFSVIAFNPTYWNAIARYELRTRTLTKLFNSQYKAAGLFGTTVLLLSLLRAVSFHAACDAQPHLELLENEYFVWLGYFIWTIGAILIATSFLKLGFYGTLHGDYFGIIVFDEPLTDFPFNVFSDPMYVGTVLYFGGTAILLGSPAGLLLSVWIGITYWVACLYEWPYTKKIYSVKDKYDRGLLKETDEEYRRYLGAHLVLKKD